MEEHLENIDSSLELLFPRLEKVLEQNENILNILKSMNIKPTYNNNNNYQAKEVDRDSSEYKNKRNIYVKKLNEKVIKEPKQSSLDYYQVKYKEDTKKYI